MQFDRLKRREFTTLRGGAAGAERQLTAILAADVAGYSRLVENDEEGTLTQWKAHWHALLEPKIKEFHGRVVRVIGDGVLVEFARKNVLLILFSIHKKS